MQDTKLHEHYHPNFVKGINTYIHLFICKKLWEKIHHHVNSEIVCYFDCFLYMFSISYMIIFKTHQHWPNNYAYKLTYITRSITLNIKIVNDFKFLLHAFIFGK